MDLRELEVFCAAARLGSMSNAAAALGMDQSRVTEHIQRLERTLGVSLFDRNRRPVRLTSSGEQLLRVADRIVDAVRELPRIVAGAMAVESVAIAATRVIVSYILAPAIQALRAARPRTRVNIITGPIPQMLSAVSSRDAEVAVIPWVREVESFDYEHIIDVGPVLLAPRDHPLLDGPSLTWEKLALYPVLMPPSATSPNRRRLDEEMKRRGLDVEVAMEINDYEAIKRYVAIGMGVSVAPSICIEGYDRRRLGVLGLDALLPSSPVGVVSVRGRKLSECAAALIDSLRDAARSAVG